MLESEALQSTTVPRILTESAVISGAKLVMYLVTTYFGNEEYV